MIDNQERHAIDGVLQTLEGISLEQMDQVKLMNRIDTKFGFSIHKLADFLAILKDDYRVFEIENTRAPFYESLYFDDDEFGFYHDHHNNKMSRFKVRVRKYVESNLHFLEVKHKFKGRTDKQRMKVAGFGEEFSDEQIAFLAKVLDTDFRDLQSCLWNSFNRITLVNKNEPERLTLDFNLKFKWGEHEVELDNLVIAELKQERLNRNSVFYQLMKTHHIRPYRLSKYCIGSIELHGRDKIKYNRFKKKLLTLKKINDDNAA